MPDKEYIISGECLECGHWRELIRANPARCRACYLRDPATKAMRRAARDRRIAEDRERMRESDRIWDALHEIRAAVPGERCRDCPTVLSIYNTSPYCARCRGCMRKLLGVLYVPPEQRKALRELS